MLVKKKLSLKIIILIISTGIVLSLFFILPNYFDVSNYRTTNDFTIEYSEGFSGVNVDFRMSHRIGDSFDTLLIYQTISSADIEQIGIIDMIYDVYRDEDLIYFNDLDFTEPRIYGYNSFIFPNIDQYNNISCSGTIRAQFNVSGIIQEETFNFVVSIIMPVEPIEIRNQYLLNSILIYTGLSFGLLILIGLIYRNITTWKHEIRYTDEEIKKDKEFFDYLSSKAKQGKKNSS